MKEADIRLSLHHALQWRGWWPLHHQDGRKYPCVHCGKWNVITPDVRGRPDTEARHPKFPTAFIEVKMVPGLSFAFNEITPEQHRYLTSWMNEGGQSYLCLGKIVTRGATQTKIDSIMVIPWNTWLGVERAGGKSVPYDFKYYQNDVRAEDMDLAHWISDFCYLKLLLGEWHFQNEHPLAVQPEIDVPFFKRSKEKNES